MVVHSPKSRSTTHATGNDRGWFSETYKQPAPRDAGIDIDFVQDNESFSAPARTLRGLHYQLAPHAQDKLVRVVYKVSTPCAPKCERAIRWDDPDLAISWQLPPGVPTLSGDIAIAPTLADQADLI